MSLDAIENVMDIDYMDVSNNNSNNKTMQESVFKTIFKRELQSVEIQEQDMECLNLAKHMMLP